MKRTYIQSLAVSLLLLLPTVSASAQATAQKDSLSKNAYAIVRNYSAVFSQSDINNATYKVFKEVTILNKKGENYGNFYSYGDKFVELKDFNGVIKNQFGTVVKKIGKKDLTISSLSDQMASDDYHIFYECNYPTYPYTIEYSYEQKWKNGIIHYPPFWPLERPMQSVEHADYRIELPAGTNLRYKSNFDCKIKDETLGNKHVYTFSADGIKAIEIEAYAPPFTEIAPSVLIAPSDFCYDGVCGNIASWNNFGMWTSQLLKDRDIIPEILISKIKEIIKDAKSDREKVEITYKYLQNNWRYVSIQLGIGGLQPIEAASVAKTKFGDCKGLSNLMKAMLKAINIPSNYSKINMGDEKNFIKDFSSMGQTNHVILLVPLKNDSIWLECTSSRNPFGYVHNRIAGHDALVITENGGKVCRLPNYTDQQNKKDSKVLLNIGEDGKATGSMSFIERLQGYDRNSYYITSNDRERHVRYINEEAKFPKIKINKITTSEQKTALPSCSIEAEFEAEEFANKTGSRLFIPICPLDKGNYNVFASANRNFDIDIKYGYSEADSITINIPESYTPESLPKNVAIDTPFGKLTTKVEQTGNQIVYTQYIEIFTGRYDKAQYKDIKAFFAEITSNVKRKLVLKKV